MHRIFKASNITMDTEGKAVDNSNPDLYNNIKAEEDLPDENATAEHAAMDAERIRQQAKREAEKIIADAKNEGEKLRAEAESEGRKKGYDDGYSAGKRDTDGIKAEAEQFREQTRIEREEMIKSVEPQMLELTISIAKKLLGDAVELSPAVVRNLILQGLNETTLKGNVNIRVSKEDYDAAVKGRELFLSKIESGTEIEIIKDPILGRADCIIETPFGDIDCSLDQQFESLRQNLYFILNANGRAGTNSI